MTERFRSTGRGGFELIINGADPDAEWVAMIVDPDGGIIATSRLAWTDFQRLGLFVNRATRLHAKQLKVSRGS